MIEEAKKIVWTTLVIALLFGLFSVFKLVFKPKDDGLVEEAIESVIEAKSGLKIDLTPDTPE